jgi:hypothetical protein
MQMIFAELRIVLRKRSLYRGPRRVNRTVISAYCIVGDQP